MKSLTITEFVRHFSDYVNRVSYRNESFLLRKGSKAVAELRPTPSGRRLGDLPGLFESLPPLTDREAREFAEDLALIREDASKESPRDPWASS
ncbi:MAG TPA: hypothetical protein VM492_17070 [Sumerlaeia bacterium]|nr:hypothetical protein [Sumerlaeia bacterium]